MDNITAIILCGGKGTRLRPLTNNLPKPLINLNDKPILYYIVNHLIKYNINKFIIATGYKSDMIEKFMINNFSKLNYKIVNSGDVGILERIKDSIKYVKDDFLLCYGDTISNINIDELINFHNTKESSVTISSYPITIPFGVMSVNDDNIVESFNEKPRLESVMNIGYFYFPKNKFSQFNNCADLLDVINNLIDKKLLRCFEHNNIHITINTISELEYAEKNIKKIL